MKVKNSIIRVILNILHKGIEKYVAIGIVYVLTPLLIYIDSIRGYNIGYMIEEKCSRLYPIAAVILMYILLKEKLKYLGNELYYIKRNAIITEIITLYLLFLVSVAIPFIFYGFLMDLSMGVYIKVSIVSFIYYGLGYFLVFLTKSAMTVFIPCFIITANDMFTMYNEISELFNYSSWSIFRFEAGHLVFLIIGVITFIIGYILNLKYQSYK